MTILGAPASHDRDYQIPDIVRNALEGPRGVDAAKKPSVAAQLLAWFKANTSSGEFGIIVKNANIMRDVLAYENEREQARRAKGHLHRRILDVEPLPSLTHHMRLAPQRVKAGRGFKIQYGAMQGTFRIRVTESLSIFLVSWGPSPKETAEMAIGSQKAFDVLFERLETRRRRLIRNAPPKGLWELMFERVGMTEIPHFVRKKIDVENTERFSSHPMYPQLREDMEDFFSRLDFWTRYGQSGMRKILLVGPPGTGKTSIAMALASVEQSGKLVVYADGSREVMVAAELAAAKKRPTIIIAEEVDMLHRPDGATLNWLDGSQTPRNLAGTYFICTTNYPRKIDPRILKRPGRIDRLLRVGALRPSAAATVALSFLGADAGDLDQKALGRVLDRTTPAEIREIISLALRAIPPGGTLGIEHLEATRSGLKQSLAEIEDAGDDDPDTREDQHKRFGAREDDIAF